MGDTINSDLLDKEDFAEYVKRVESLAAPARLTAGIELSPEQTACSDSAVAAVSTLRPWLR